MAYVRLVRFMPFDGVNATAVMAIVVIVRFVVAMVTRGGWCCCGGLGGEVTICLSMTRGGLSPVLGRNEMGLASCSWDMMSGIDGF